MIYKLLQVLRIVIPVLTLVILAWCIGVHPLKLIIALLVGLGYGIFMEAFGYYERDVEEYKKARQRR